MALSDPPAERRQNAGAWIHHMMCLERNSFMLLEITALIVLIFLVRELRKKLSDHGMRLRKKEEVPATLPLSYG